MSVPLDRLYNFLHDVCNRDDIIIYRFYPHGSKKLDDLTTLSDKKLSWYQLMTYNSLICHDQEVLKYDLYSKQDFYLNREKRHNQAGRDIVADMHFRACLDLPFNGNDQVLLCHSEKHSSELAKFESNNFIGVYYWSHAVIARDWFRYAEVDQSLVPNFDRITKDFLIYNRAWSGTREYRLTFTEMLLNQGLHESCNTTFSAMDTGNLYTDHAFVNPSLAISRTDIEHFIGPNTASAMSSADYNNIDYAESAIEVVLETLFDDTRWHLTEKALRPIACGRPFILACTPGSLQYLKEYGFETFNGLIDESYDSIVDPKSRLEAIAQEMKRISSLEPATKRALWEKLYAISARNQQKFFSNEWHNSIVEEFKENFNQALSKVTSTGKHWKMLLPLVVDNPVKFEADIPGFRTLDELNRFRAWLDSNQ